jgi:hypothetical protein
MNSSFGSAGSEAFLQCDRLTPGPSRLTGPRYT